VTRQTLVSLAESALLLLALAFTLAPIPSKEDPIELFPALAFAVVCFGGSRALRWKGKWILWSLEVLAFVGFAYVSNAIANLLMAI
jgi:hypothetical protein